MIRVDIMTENDVRTAIREIEDILGDVVVYVEEAEDGDRAFLNLVIEYCDGTKAHKEIADKDDFFKIVNDIKNEFQDAEKRFVDAEVMAAMRYHLDNGFFVDVAASINCEGTAEVYLGRNNKDFKLLLKTIKQPEDDFKDILTHLGKYKKQIEAFLDESELFIYSKNGGFDIIKYKSISR